MIVISDHEFALLREHLHRLCGIDVPPEKRYLFQTRLSSFLEEQGWHSFSELLTRLATGPDQKLQRGLIQAMTTHESRFFRDGHPWQLLRQQLLPELARLREADTRAGPPRLSFLSLGCSLGQEPYSIAMCVDDWLQSQTAWRREQVAIVGTDISRAILTRAAAGRFTTRELGHLLPPLFRERYFKLKGAVWQLSDQIREMVTFVESNLADDSCYLGCHHMVFCRNVIIYFSPEVKRQIVARFQRLLVPQGVLLLGASESLYLQSDAFVGVQAGATTYYVRSDARALSSQKAGAGSVR